MIRPPAPGDMIVGGMLILTSVFFFVHAIRNEPKKRKLRFVAIGLAIVGAIMILSEPIVSLLELQ